jgi:hypothetical protein
VGILYFFMNALTLHVSMIIGSRQLKTLNLLHLRCGGFWKVIGNQVLIRDKGVPSAEWRRHGFFRADAILPKEHNGTATVDMGVDEFLPSSAINLQDEGNGKRKYEMLTRRKRESMYWLGRITERDPNLFVLWRLVIKPKCPFGGRD